MKVNEYKKTQILNDFVSSKKENLSMREKEREKKLRFYYGYLYIQKIYIETTNN